MKYQKKELLTRLIYDGTAHLNRKEDEVWLTLIGLWECHNQFIGISKPRKKYFIDDVIPEWI